MMGCTYIQFDDVPLTKHDQNVRSELTDVGMDPDRLLDDYTQLFNDCLRDRPDITVAIILEATTGPLPIRGRLRGHIGKNV